eukprot:537978-Prymnesium_polylepis.1
MSASTDSNGGGGELAIFCGRGADAARVGRGQERPRAARQPVAAGTRRPPVDCARCRRGWRAEQRMGGVR